LFVNHISLDFRHPISYSSIYSERLPTSAALPVQKEDQYTALCLCLSLAYHQGW